MFPIPATSSQRTLPTRVDSLNSSKHATFNQIEEELRDVRRVHSQGQEEDLRMALSRTISRVEELSSMLKEAYKAQTELQTELTLAKSNLQLALANNEMLEDALKREGAGHSKDVGWRRWSAKEQRERELAADSRRHSMESLTSNDAITSPVPPSPLPSASAPPPTSESRFFKFRFGATSSPVGGSPRLPGNASPTPNGTTQASHLTSASLPSLVPVRDKDKELEDLAGLLDRERKAHKEAKAAKDALEAEIESLSQALFEEANKMVAAERMKLAETEEELKEAQAEKEALRSALRLVENQRIDADSRSASAAGTPEPFSPMSASPSVSVSAHAHKRSSSSAIAIKSLPPSQPSSPRSSPSVSIDADADTTLRAPVPPPLSLPEIGLFALPASSDDARTPTPESKAADEPTPSSLPQGHAHAPSVGAADDVAADDSLAPAPPSSSDEVEPSPSPTPSPGQFAYASARPPISYFDSEESPWADVRSQTPVTAGF
ncbi:hypothetical protein EIP86_001027 [Pleurotus ostreatoroseus]|nr:hypothetical protein EIP86_001027 [Pleurotus ostreatoroseus]